jgi:hypothetical protein
VTPAVENKPRDASEQQRGFPQPPAAAPFFSFFSKPPFGVPQQTWSPAQQSDVPQAAYSLPGGSAHAGFSGLQPTPLPCSDESTSRPELLRHVQQVWGTSPEPVRGVFSPFPQAHLPPVSTPVGASQSPGARHSATGWGTSQLALWMGTNAVGGAAVSQSHAAAACSAPGPAPAPAPMRRPVDPKDSDLRPDAPVYTPGAPVLYNMYNKDRFGGMSATSGFTPDRVLPSVW